MTRLSPPRKPMKTALSTNTDQTLPTGHTPRDWRLERVVDTLVRECLEFTRGNRHQAAVLLGISRATLFRRLRTMTGAPRPARRKK